MKKEDYLAEEIKRLARINDKLEERFDERSFEYSTLCKTITENASTMLQIVEAR